MIAFKEVGQTGEKEDFSSSSSFKRGKEKAIKISGRSRRELNLVGTRE